MIRPLPALLLLLLVPGTPAGAQAGAPPADAETAAGFSVRSPFRSREKSLRLLDFTTLKILADLGYEQKASKGRPQTWGPEGVETARSYSSVYADTERELSLALAAHPAGGFEIFVRGFEGSGPERRPNPDLRAVEEHLTELLWEVDDSRRSGIWWGPDVGYYPVQLSYAQSDRVLAVLKALGYGVVQFHEAGAEVLQAAVYDRVFEVAGDADSGAATAAGLPFVVQLIDSEKTSLLDPTDEELSDPTPNDSANLQLGGRYLDKITSGVPQQRLLVVYDKGDVESLEGLLNLLRDQLDVPARQILIEALVIEIDQDRLREIGVEFEGSKDGSTFSFGTGADGLIQPFSYVFATPSVESVLNLNVKLTALVDRGEAQLLSRPSVLVLDGRQARIQVGEKIPYTSEVAATQTATLQSIDYLPVGIVLNLRPRASEDETYITMQVETIISSAGASRVLADSGVLVAPPIQSREVQTLVRVAHNTPFIIGGLFSTTKQKTVSGIPGLSKIPVLGALFRKKGVSDTKREVIVVITPYVIPPEERSFTYTIAKSTEILESFESQLFRNTYRVRSSDVFDLDFVHRNRHLKGIRSCALARPDLTSEEPLRSMVDGTVPGEEILVRRMLWELIEKKEFGQHVDPKKISYFRAVGGGLDFSRLYEILKQRTRERNATVLEFDTGSSGSGSPLKPPVPEVTRESLPTVPRDAYLTTYLERLREGNCRRSAGEGERAAVVLTRTAFDPSQDDQDDSSPDQMLRSILVLKRLLELNSETLPLTLEGYRVGTEVIFPSADDMAQRFHLVDREAAGLFYQVVDFYYAFEREFTRQLRAACEQLEGECSVCQELPEATDLCR